MSTKETGHSRQMDKALFDFYGKPSFGQAMPLAIQHHIITVIPVYKNQMVRHRLRTSGYDGYQFCLCTKYAGNCSRI